MKTRMINMLCLMAFMVGLVPLQAQNPRDLISRMDDNMRGESMYSEMTMETIRPRFTREVSLRSWSLGSEFSLIVITAPVRDKGTAFLKRGQEIWNYVPNIDRTVKMPPSMMSQSWMGSDFSNDDLVRGVSLTDDYTHVLRGEENPDGQRVYVVELTPKPEAPVVFEKVVYWICAEHILPVKLENFDEFGDLVSTVRFSEVKRMGDRLIPSRIEMVPADKPNHKTILTTHRADYGIRLDPSFFSQQNMRNIR